VSNPHPIYPYPRPYGGSGAYDNDRCITVTVLIIIYIMLIIFVIISISALVITGFKRRLFPTHHLKMSTVIKVLIHCLVLLRGNVILKYFNMIDSHCQCFGLIMIVILIVYNMELKRHYMYV
jgi:hypothetical protein